MSNAAKLERVHVLAYLALFVPLVYVVAAQGLDPAAANHDVAWTLHAGGRLLEGATYGVDVIELNPPFVLGLTALVAGVAELLGTPVIATYNVLVLGLIALGGLLLMRGLADFIEPAWLRAALATLFAVIVAVLPRYAFGQREQLICLLLLPHLLLAAREEGALAYGRGARIAVGLSAAAALAMKPHYALVWLSVEALFALRERAWRRALRLENAVTLAACVAYLAGIVLFLPRYFEAMRDAAELYHTFDGQLQLLGLRTLPLCVALLLAAFVRPSGGAGRLAAAALVASAASLVAVVLQSKGYLYHYVPCVLFALLSILCTLAALLLRHADRAPTLARLVNAGALLLAAGLVANALLWPVDRHPDYAELVRVVEEYGEGESVLFLASTVDPAFPVVNLTGAGWPLPWPSLWWVSGHYTADDLAREEFAYRELDAMSERERRYVTRVLDRIEAEPPRLLFLDHSRYKMAFGSVGFLFERYLAADPRLPQLLAQYRPIGVVAGFGVARRIDVPPAASTQPEPPEPLAP